MELSMTTRHTISRADTLFSGSAYYPPANALPGLPVDILNYVVLGAVALASANAIATSQASSGGTNALAINGALATAGVATIPTPRNVVAAWTTTAIMTITGTDYYGQVQTEVSASGTSHTGKKAFKTITAITFSTAVTAATVGTGVVIGLPYRVDKGGMIIAKVDNATDAATFVPADTTSPATTTTGDVRGTVTFASAPDGTKVYNAVIIIADRTGGVGKIVGAYGVTPV
jgi:hypothetical protein